MDGDIRGAVLLLLLPVAATLWPARVPEVAGPPCPEADLREVFEVERGARLVCAASCGEAACKVPGGRVGLLLGRPLDVNEASALDLDALPGIGPGLARRIVIDRRDHGPFGGLDELTRVRGIGEARVHNLRGWALAEPPNPGYNQSLSSGVIRADPLREVRNALHLR